VLDVHGRRILHRTTVLPNLELWLPRLLNQLDRIRERLGEVALSICVKHVRGRHWFCIFGSDRNNKKVSRPLSSLTATHL
jgi:hypothetical protein